MKLLPEVPTQEIAAAVKKIEDAYGLPIPFTEVYSAIFTAAPDVNDDRIAALEAEVVKLKREKDDLMFKFVASQVVPEWAVK